MARTRNRSIASKASKIARSTLMRVAVCILLSFIKSSTCLGHEPGLDTARRGSHDPAETPDRRSPTVQETFGHHLWLGHETGHSAGNKRKPRLREKPGFVGIGSVFDGDVLGLSTLGLRNDDRQHAVLVLRVDVFGINIVTQTDHPAKLAVVPFDAVPGFSFLFLLLLAFAGDPQVSVPQFDVELFRLQAGQVDRDLILLVGLIELRQQTQRVPLYASNICNTFGRRRIRRRRHRCALLDIAM